MIDVGTHQEPYQYLVLDHGYVKLVGKWGSEEGVIEAARMSTGKGFKGWGPVHSPECDAVGDTLRAQMSDKVGYVCSCEPVAGDEKLLSYLYTHKHMSPFEMAGLTIEVQAPIFVFREWMRHRTQSFNEMSARYTPLPDLNYVPSVERLTMDGGANKQAQTIGGHKVSLSDAEATQIIMRHAYKDMEEQYQQFLKDGVPKELARIILPVGRYSRMRASANLRNWLQFMTLRCDSAAQWEIRQFSDAVSEIVRGLFPRTWELWNANN